MAYGCHKCPHKEQIEAARSRCLSCTRCNGDRVKIGDASMVHLDAMENEHGVEVALALSRRLYNPADDTGDSRTDVPADVLPWLERALEPFTRLTDPEALLVCAMMRGETVAEIARRIGELPQTTHFRWQRLLQKNPLWRVIANGDIGKGKGRKPKAEG